MHRPAELRRTFCDKQKAFEQEQSVNVSRRTVQRKKQEVARLGALLVVKGQATKKRTLGSFRLENIRNYLISFDKYVCATEKGNQDRLVFENGPCWQQ